VAAMGTFCFVTLTLRNPPMEIGEIIGIYVAQVVLTNEHLNFCRAEEKIIFGQVTSCQVAPTAQDRASHAGLCHAFLVHDFTQKL